MHNIVAVVHAVHNHPWCPSRLRLDTPRPHNVPLPVSSVVDSLFQSVLFGRITGPLGCTTFGSPPQRAPSSVYSASAREAVMTNLICTLTIALASVSLFQGRVLPVAPERHGAGHLPFEVCRPQKWDNLHSRVNYVPNSCVSSRSMPMSLFKSRGSRTRRAGRILASRTRADAHTSQQCSIVFFDCCD